MRILPPAIPARIVLCTLLASLLCTHVNADSPQPASPQVVAATDVAAGRYIVTIGGCNDCHTPGWMETGGAVAESAWLTGSPIGWRGPWGTTYASNLRLYVQDLDEETWVTTLATRKARPPMPWMNLNLMTAADSRKLYRYIRSLGSAGERMPLALAPGVEPATPFYLLDQMPPKTVNAAAVAEGVSSE